MTSRWAGLVVAAMVLSGAAPLWADEADTAALKSEIEGLKARLSSLERRLVESEAKGITTIGGKPGLPTLELPSGLAGLQMSGYADISYMYNFAEADPPTTVNAGRVFDRDAHGFTPHAFELVLEKPTTDAMPFGFRTDLFFGDDAEQIHPIGLGDVSAASENPQAFDLQQAYITYHAPVGDGIDLKVGKFVTLLGAEVIESPANWNFSRSYMFGFSIPFTHTGVLASYPLGEWGSTTVGVVNGWDIVDDNNKAKSLIGNITLTPVESVTLSVNGITGPERSRDSRNKRTVLSNIVTWTTPLEGLTLMANYDFGHESGLAQATATATKGFEAANWQGLALYAKYDVTDTWSLAGRWEWFDDKDNTRTRLTSLGGSRPVDIDFYGYTLTNQWKLREHVLARLEYRHDKADEMVFTHDEGLTTYQDTVSAELIYHF